MILILIPRVNLLYPAYSRPDTRPGQYTDLIPGRYYTYTSIFLYLPDTCPGQVLYLRIYMNLQYTVYLNYTILQDSYTYLMPRIVTYPGTCPGTRIHAQIHVGGSEFQMSH